MDRSSRLKVLWRLSEFSVNPKMSAQFDGVGLLAYGSFFQGRSTTKLFIRSIYMSESLEFSLASPYTYRYISGFDR